LTHCPDIAGLFFQKQLVAGVPGRFFSRENACRRGAARFLLWKLAAADVWDVISENWISLRGPVGISL